MKQYRYLAYAIIVAWAGSQHAAAITTILSGRTAPIYDTEDKRLTSGYEAVCSLYDEDFRWFGSGVLISDNEVLTAGHCIDGLAWVSFDGGRHYWKVWAAWAHPDYSESGHHADIGLAVLEGCPPVTPIPISDHPAEVGQSIKQIGYGPDEKKRETPNNITIGIFADDDLCWFPTPSHATPGDSGGAVLVLDKGDCRYELVGITTWGAMDNTGEVVLSGATIVGEYESWISSIIANEPNIGRLP